MTEGKKYKNTNKENKRGAMNKYIFNDLNLEKFWVENDNFM